ncbi:MAG: choice-of-anchor tandem repeat GloVer-containing protein [Candidatus Cybelea sp.]
MKRCYVVTVLVVGAFSLAACGSESNGAFAPRLPAASVRPLSDVLYSFGGSPDGANPDAGLVAGKKGEYYGTSAGGGSPNCEGGCGTVYEITAAGKERVLYSFQGASDGANPYATLIMDKEGALYGGTESGGNADCGTVFKLTPGKQGWTESVLYVFQGGSDGLLPAGGLVMTKSGALLGTTEGGGSDDGGVVFELTPSGSTYSEKIVHSFTGPPDGLTPLDALVSDSSGNLYGTTQEGGDTTFRRHVSRNGWGAVFKLTPSGSTYTESVIYRFKGASDGEYPASGLLPGANGTLFGLTEAGGRKFGTVFELVPKGSSYHHSVLYSFQGHTDGAYPEDTPGLVADWSGNLYGTTAFGGTSCDCGTVFKLAPSGSRYTESVLHAFQGGTGDGLQPRGGVVIDSKGNLLGPTNQGGLSFFGTIFSVAP